MTIDEFKDKWGTKLDPDFDTKQIKLVDKAFSLFDKKFIKNKVKSIMLEDMGGVHGKWSDRKDHKMILNPRIFNFKRKLHHFDKRIPYNLFIIVHELGHCIDHLEKISFGPEWKRISGWKTCDINDKIEKGFKRYIEKRKGREAAGHKKSSWIHKEDAHFCRKYSSRSPREDFADSFSFSVFDILEKFHGKDGKKKEDIIQKVLKQINI
jgi:hypothetical protein